MFSSHQVQFSFIVHLFIHFFLDIQRSRNNRLEQWKEDDEKRKKCGLRGARKKKKVYRVLTGGHLFTFFIAFSREISFFNALSTLANQSSYYTHADKSTFL